MVSAVSWNNVVVHAAINFDLEPQLIFFQDHKRLNFFHIFSWVCALSDQTASYSERK
jgi:hypothetical protein